MGNRWRQAIWPVLTDDESARAAVRRAIKACAIWAIICVGLGAITLISGKRVDDSGPYAELVLLVCGALFGLIAWNVRNMSLTWAIVGLLVSVAGLINELWFARSLVELICYSYVVLAFINAVRATIFWRRLDELDTVPITDAERLGN